MNENTVLNIKNKSHAVTAEITVRDSKASGAIIVQGGRFAGWGLYLKSGVPAHCYNYFGFEHVYAPVHVSPASAYLVPNVVV